MTRLDRLDARTAEAGGLVERLDRDGAVVLENALGPEQVDAILSELAPFIEETAPFDDDFVGRRTTRTGALVARSKAVRDAVLHPRILEVADRFLCRCATGYQLNLTQIMRILPGERAQALHRDRYLWTRFLPREIEPMLNGMWALSDFTEESGATRIIPGSQSWEWSREGRPEESIPAEMPRGAMLLYTGSILHGGGENRSPRPRVGLSITYLLDWLRQEENQYLSCPPEIARSLEPRLKALLGYSTGNGGLGYYSPLAPSQGQIDTLPPECIVGGRATSQAQEPF